MIDKTKKETCNLTLCEGLKDEIREMLSDTTKESISAYLTRVALLDLKKWEKKKRLKNG